MNNKFIYISRIARREIWNAGYVELWDFSRSNDNEESRVEAIATVASICYGKPTKDAKKLVNRLMKEHCGLPASSFEFIRTGGRPSIKDSLRNRPIFPNDGWVKRSKDTWSDEHRKHRENIATFKIKIPVFIRAQLQRHRGFSYQEISRRYCKPNVVPFEFWHNEDTMDTEIEELAVKRYNELVENGVRPGVARSKLPQSMYAEVWVQGDLCAFNNYFSVRLDGGAQKEHRELSQTMHDMLVDHQPEFKLSI